MKTKWKSNNPFFFHFLFIFFAVLYFENEKKFDKKICKAFYKTKHYNPCINNLTICSSPLLWFFFSTLTKDFFMELSPLSKFSSNKKESPSTNFLSMTPSASQFIPNFSFLPFWIYTITNPSAKEWVTFSSFPFLWPSFTFF